MEDKKVKPVKEKKDKKLSKKDKTITIIGIIVCILMIPILVVNVTMIVTSYVNEDKVPNVFGVTPLAVTSDSMYPYIEKGDMIICTTVDPDRIYVDFGKCFGASSRSSH